MGLNEALRKTEQVFVESMDDDFHTPKAIASLFEMIRQVNGHMEKGTDPASLAQVARRIRDLAGILGLLQNRRDIHSMGVVETKAVSWEQYQEARQRLESSPEGIPSSGVEEIKTVLLWRAEARKRGEWSTSDEIREWLRRAGVAVEDTREGFYWKYKST